MGAVESLEVCPACGEFVNKLIEKTGWCALCSGMAVCISCGRPFPFNKSGHKICGTCRDKADRKKIRGKPFKCVVCNEWSYSCQKQTTFMCGKKECRNVYKRVWRRAKRDHISIEQAISEFRFPQTVYRNCVFCGGRCRWRMFLSPFPSCHHCNNLANKARKLYSTFDVPMETVLRHIKKTYGTKKHVPTNWSIRVNKKYRTRKAAGE